MTLKGFLHDVWGKVAVALAVTAVIAVVTWLQSQLVFAGDLEPIAEAVKALADESREQQDEWRCSELEEELADFYAKQEALPSGESLSQREIDRMARIKERMGDGETGLKCARFDD